MRWQGRICARPLTSACPLPTARPLLGYSKHDLSSTANTRLGTPVYMVGWAGSGAAHLQRRLGLPPGRRPAGFVELRAGSALAAASIAPGVFFGRCCRGAGQAQVVLGALCLHQLMPGDPCRRQRSSSSTPNTMQRKQMCGAAVRLGEGCWEEEGCWEAERPALPPVCRERAAVLQPPRVWTCDSGNQKWTTKGAMPWFLGIAPPPI